MPFGDGTGPSGMGPLTGRGLGPCAATGAAMYPLGRGRGFGAGLGRGRGFGRGYFANPYGAAPMDEKTILQNQINNLEGQIDVLKSRLNES